MEPVESKRSDRCSGRLGVWLVRLVLYGLAVGLMAVVWHRRSADHSDRARVAARHWTEPHVLDGEHAYQRGDGPTPARDAVGNDGHSAVDESEVDDVDSRFLQHWPVRYVLDEGRT